jgi:hypothetical protein
VLPAAMTVSVSERKDAECYSTVACIVDSRQPERDFGATAGMQMTTRPILHSATLNHSVHTL